jgi:hypothetical protein
VIGFIGGILGKNLGRRVTMSQTYAESALEAAKKHVDLAVAELSKIVDDKCYGTDELSKERLHDIFRNYYVLETVKEFWER